MWTTLTSSKSAKTWTIYTTSKLQRNLEKSTKKWTIFTKCKLLLCNPENRQKSGQILQGLGCISVIS